MAGKSARGNPVAVSDLATAILDPVMRKRAGISMALVQSWDDIVGAVLSGGTRPQKLHWPRRRDEDEPFQPGTLVIACTAASALRLQHETSEIIARVNAFLGFPAVARIRIVQKVLAVETRRAKKERPILADRDRQRLADLTDGVEDADLRASLITLGESVIARRRG